MEMLTPICAFEDRKTLLTAQCQCRKILFTINSARLYKRQEMKSIHRNIPVLILAAMMLVGTDGEAAESKADRMTFGNPIVTQGAVGSLVRQVESAVIIPGDTHEDLWVHPELMTIPGQPLVIELRARTTDRLGKDKHSTWHYFRTDDAFRTLQPLSVPTTNIWKRKDLAIGDLAISPTTSGQAPKSLGHTWCSAYVYLDARTILQAFTTRNGEQYSVQSLVARFASEGLVPQHVSHPWTIAKGRGLYEPQIAGFQGRHYMTVRAEDGRGYVLVSADGGRTWAKPKPWTWDNGEEIPMNQTMTKFAAHSDGLALVYTRIREDNTNTFRNRAPLHVADVNLETLSLKRSTERIIVPNRSTGPKGLPVCNFWVWPINQQETYMTVAEWPRDGRPQNGDIWLSKIQWQRPNQLMTPEGREKVMEQVAK